MVYYIGANNIASNYKLYNSVILNLETSLYVFNNRARFISNIKPILKRVYIGLYIEEIVGYSIAIVTINNLKGKCIIIAPVVPTACLRVWYTNHAFTR